MKRLFKKIWAVSMIIALMCPMTVVASPKGRMMLDQNSEESVLLPITTKYSVGQESVVGRSKALASAMCMITNTEKGIIHIYAETAMFIPVDWAALTIYLEKLNESTNKWTVVETFEK